MFYSPTPPSRFTLLFQNEKEEREEGGLRVNGRDSIKIIPRNLEDYLTPLALVIWLLNDGFAPKLGRANLDPAF